MALLVLWIGSTFGQQTSAQPSPAPGSEVLTIRGTVCNLDGKPVAEALVHLEGPGIPGAQETRTDGAGGFTFWGLKPGGYRVSADKFGLRSQLATVVLTSGGDQERAVLILRPRGTSDPGPESSSPGTQAMEFADKPNFSVAGVTDWTAVGGHGSDSSLRTSEALANETLTLQAEGPGHSTAGGAGDAHRVAGEYAEKHGDPLTAVHEFEEAARLDPSEANYFEWGSELLLHRAVQQAEQILHEGAELHPKSERMLAGLGAALFAGARYEEAVARLCTASDLNPTDAEPYTFMGKIQIAAPDPLPCVERSLARFVRLQPADSLANYFYAMAILKRQKQAADKPTMEQAESLLTKAVTLDNKCSDGYLQLGILAADRRDYARAIDFYAKAIQANPLLGDAHYRLGVAYDRIGEPAKAKREFELHDKLKQKEAEEIERQRSEVKQFLVVRPGQLTSPSPK